MAFAAARLTDLRTLPPNAAPVRKKRCGREWKVTFDQLMRQRDFQPIRHCPGRYVLSSARYSGPPQDLAGAGLAVFEFRVEAARDLVLVTPLPEGAGLISYQQADGAFLHTLNTAPGFQRKLRQLGISLPEFAGGASSAAPATAIEES
jgi:hypothetical protein